MKKKGDFQLSPIIKAIIVLLVVVVIIFFWNSTAFAGIRAILGFDVPGQNQNIEPLTNYDFYNIFVNQYQACKLSPFTECRCEITSLESRLPAGYAIELTESGGNVEINLVKFTGIYKTTNSETFQFENMEKDTAAKLLIINNDKLLAKQEYSVNWETRNGVKYPKFDDFTEKIKISIFATQEVRKDQGIGGIQLSAGTYLGTSTKDDEYSTIWLDEFTNYIYKYSLEKTGFLAKKQIERGGAKWDDIEECTAPKNVVEANEKFESFVKEINDVNSGTGSTKTVKLELPADYTLKQEGSELLLNYAYYPKKEIQKSATSLCPTDKDLPNGNYALAKDNSVAGSPCVIMQLQNP